MLSSFPSVGRASASGVGAGSATDAVDLAHGREQAADPELVDGDQRRPQSALGDATQWLKGQEICIITLWNDAPLAVTPPNFVELVITETDPGVRGDTSGGGGKPAKLETGAVVRVPLFVGQGEKVKVDTRSGEYVSRVK